MKNLFEDIPRSKWNYDIPFDTGGKLSNIPKEDFEKELFKIINPVIHHLRQEPAEFWDNHSAGELENIKFCLSQIYFMATLALPECPAERSIKINIGNLLHYFSKIISGIGRSAWRVGWEESYDNIYELFKDIPDGEVNRDNLIEKMNELKKNTITKQYLEKFDRTKEERLPLFEHAKSIWEKSSKDLAKIKALIRANEDLKKQKSEHAVDENEIYPNSAIYRSFCRYLVSPNDE